MRALPLMLATLAAACVPATPAPPPVAPPPVTVAATPKPLAADWRDWPKTAGTWSYRADGGMASFGAGTTPRLTLRCDRAQRRVTIMVPGDIPGATALTVRTSSTLRTLPIQAGAASIAAADTLLDAMAFSRGQFVIEQSGVSALVIPAYAEVGRVVQDCRDG